MSPNLKLMSFKLGRVYSPTSTVNFSARAVHGVSPLDALVHAMNNEKKAKAKKKTLLKKEKDNDGEMNEKSSEAPQQSLLLADPCFKRSHACRERGTNIPVGFYIAHPQNIKWTARFKDVHSRKLAELLEAFHMFDFDRDGEINEEDLRKTFRSLCMAVEEEQIKQMLSEALSPLNFDSFVILLGYRTLDLDPEEVLLDALSNWDDQDDGLISYERLVQHMMAWGDKFTEEEAKSALADAPVVLNKTKEKMIDYIQFSEDLCGLRKMLQKRANEPNK